MNTNCSETKDTEVRGGHSSAATTDHLPGATMMVATTATREVHPGGDLVDVVEEEDVGATANPVVKTRTTVKPRRLKPAMTL